MAEQIDIASLNFDTGKLMESVVRTRQEIDNLRSAMGESRKTMRENQKQADELTKAQKELEEQGKSNSQEYKDNEEKLKNLSKAQEAQTKNIIAQESQLRKLSKEQRELNKIIDLQSKSNNDSVVAMEAANAALSMQWQNENQATEAARAMYAARKNLNPAIKEEAELMEQLANRINEANVYNTQFNTQSEKRVKNIGNYTSSILEAISATTGLGKAGKGAIPGLSGLTAGAQAFSAVPLFTVVSLIVTAFKFLSEQFKSTQEGMDAITAVTRPLTAVLDVLKGMVAQLASVLVSAFTEPKKYLTELSDYIRDKVIKHFTGLFNIAKSLVTLDWSGLKQGVSDVVENIVDIGRDVGNVGAKMYNNLKDAYDMGKQQDRLLKEITQKETDLVTLRSQSQLQLDKINEKLNDGNLSYSEKVKYANEQLKIEQELAAQQRNLVLLKLSELKVQEAIKGATDETRRQTAELVAELDSIDRGVQARINRNQKYIAGAQKEQAQADAEAHKKRMAEILERQKIELDTYVLLNKKNKESIEDELNFAREVSERKQAILDRELKNGIKNRETYNYETLKLQTELAEQEAEITLFYSTQLLNEEILALEKRRSEMKRLTIDNVRETADEIDRIWNEQQANVKSRLDAGLIDRHEYNEEIKKLESTRNKEIEDLNKQWQNQIDEDWKLRRLLENEAKLLDITDQFERERELERQNHAEKLADLEEQRKEGLIAESNYLLAIENLNKESQKRQKDINQQALQHQVGMYSNALGQISNIVGAQTEAGKAFAIAKATMDTYQGATLALATIPPPFGFVTAASVIASGLGNVRKIMSTNPQQKYTGGYTGDGGVFKRTGYTHAGEVVFNQQDVRAMGGAQRVEAMRPTSDLFGTLPTGIPQERNDSGQFELMATMVRDAVKEGAERGTNTGMVEAGENEYVKMKATF